jgi:hypothetical protein
MRSSTTLLAALLAVTAWLPAEAGQKAYFIDGHYTFAPGACDKLKALAAGGPQGVTSVPWYVTADGISFWEGGCSFEKISKGKRANEWRVVASCSEEVEEFTESYLFRRAGPGKFRVTLTTPGTKPADAKPKLYTRCDVGPIPEPQ